MSNISKSYTYHKEHILYICHTENLTLDAKCAIYKYQSSYPLCFTLLFCEISNYFPKH